MCILWAVTAFDMRCLIQKFEIFWLCGVKGDIFILLGKNQLNSRMSVLLVIFIDSFDMG